MRVTKKEGLFVVEDEPLRLEGEEATEFLAAMKQRDEVGNPPERKLFLEQCAETYRRAKR